MLASEKYKNIDISGTFNELPTIKRQNYNTQKTQNIVNNDPEMTLYNYWLQWGTRKSDNSPRPLGLGEYHF